MNVSQLFPAWISTWCLWFPPELRHNHPLEFRSKPQCSALKIAIDLQRNTRPFSACTSRLANSRLRECYTLSVWCDIYLQWVASCRMWYVLNVNKNNLLVYFPTLSSCHCTIEISINIWTIQNFIRPIETGGSKKSMATSQIESPTFPKLIIFGLMRTISIQNPVWWRL